MIDTEAKPEEVKEEPEPEEQNLKNPSRVLKAQEKVVAYKHDATVRYTPVLETRFAGFVVLSDLGAKPGEVELIMMMKSATWMHRTPTWCRIWTSRRRSNLIRLSKTRNECP